MSVLIITMPIAPGKVEAWRRFCQQLSGSRREEYAASRRRLGITRERLALIESPWGSNAVTALEVNDVGLALSEVVGSDLPFENWYRERLQVLHGVTLAYDEQSTWPAPPAQPHEVLFEWELPDTEPG
jgi:hypothetical protein